MADFFVALRKRNPHAYFLWLTPARHERVRALMRARGVCEETYREYVNGAIIVEQLANQAEQTRNRTRKVAERLFDVRRVGLKRYSRLYEAVLAKRFEA